MNVDDTLAARAAAGDHAAFDELVRRHHVRVYRLTRALTRGDGDAEDLVQETFVRAYRGIGTFRGDSAFGTWLHRIAVNVVRSHLARRRGRAMAPDDAGRDAGEIASLEDLEADVARRWQIDRALATLPPDTRLLITLRDIQGLEYQEIATIMGVPIGTVESRIFRARRKLRPLLASLRPAMREAGSS